MIEAFVTYLEAERRYSAYTVRNYKHDVEEFVGWLGADVFDPAEVGVDDVREWVVELADGRKLAAATVNAKVTALKAFYRWLRATGRAENNPTARLRAQKMPKRLPVWITEKKMEGVVERLMEKLEGGGSGGAGGFGGDTEERRDAMIVLLFYSCGVRLAEMVGLEQGDISEGYKELRVRKGKGGKERIVPIPEQAAKRLREYVEEISGAEIWKSGKKPLFLTHKGEPMSREGVYKVVREVLGGMGVEGKRSPHVLRHTYATHLMDGGADLREIQELMGHASLAATQVYTHNSIGKLKKVYKEAHPRGGGEKR